MCVRVTKWPHHVKVVPVCASVCTFIAVIHLRTKTLMVIKTLERIASAKTKRKTPIGFSRAEKCQSAELIMAPVKIFWDRRCWGTCAGARRLTTLVEWRNPSDIHSDFGLAVLCHLLDLTDASTYGLRPWADGTRSVDVVPKIDAAYNWMWCQKKGGK